MPVVLTDCSAYVGGYDFTSDVNQLTLPMEADVKDRTTFGSGGWKESIAGLRSVSFDMRGFWQSATSHAVDPEAFPDLGVPSRVYTFAPIESGAPNPLPVTDVHVAYMFQGAKFNYAVFDGGVGEVAPFMLTSQGSNGIGVKRGYLCRSRADVSATGGLGSALDTLGLGVSASQSVWATFHVFTAGTTITVQLQSDDNTGFATPTTLQTIGPLTTSGGTWMTPVPGPLTDRYYRLNVSAITGTFNVAGAIAIQ